MQLLQGKKALVTGGTSGIGLSIVQKFLENGATVEFWGTNPQKAEEALKEIRQVFPEAKISFAKIDVSSKQEVNTRVQELLKEWGNLDVLVNNAGITKDNLLMKMTEDEWDRVIDVNLKSVYNLCQSSIRSMMKAKKGKIINIASVIGLTGNPGQVNYSASKSGMIGFTKSLAKEVGSRNICVNCIAPGFIKTKMTDALNDQQRSLIIGNIPMGRYGQPEEIANAALFFASSLSDYVTGEVLAVDGGMIA